MKNWDTLEADATMILNKHFTVGRGGNTINKVVIHHNGGNLSIAGCYSVWQTREASAHYQVESSGRIGQLVWDANTAWHAGNGPANRTSIGIEHADITNSPWWVSEAALDNGAHLTAALCKYYKLGRPRWRKNVFPHRDFYATACPASLSGGQNSAYMKRAQLWYDRMTGKKPSPTPAPTSTDELQEVIDSMKATHIIFNDKDNPDALYIADILGQTYYHVPTPSILHERTVVLQRTGAKVKYWKEFSAARPATNLANKAAFGVEVPFK